MLRMARVPPHLKLNMSLTEQCRLCCRHDSVLNQLVSSLNLHLREKESLYADLLGGWQASRLLLLFHSTSPPLVLADVNISPEEISILELTLCFSAKSSVLAEDGGEVCLSYSRTREQRLLSHLSDSWRLVSQPLHQDAIKIKSSVQTSLFKLLLQDPKTPISYSQIIFNAWIHPAWSFTTLVHLL